MAEGTFGWTSPQVLGRRMSDTIIPFQYRDKHEKGFRHFLATGEGSVLNKRIEIHSAAQRRTRIPCGAGDHACAARTILDLQRILSAISPSASAPRRSSASARSCRRWGAAVGCALADSGHTRSCPAAVRGGARHALGATFARIWTLNEREGVLELQASAGLYTH